MSLRALLGHIGDLIGREVDLSFADWRAGDQRYFVADTRAAEQALALPAKVDWRTGVANLARWLAAERGFNIAIPPAVVAA